MDESRPRRRFRFGLRTLLVVVMLAAVGSWAHWIGWPWWQDYRERLAIENSIRQFQPGIRFGEFLSLIPPTHRVVRVTGFSNGPIGHETIDFEIGRAIYIVCIGVQLKRPHEICSRLELYRLPFPPVGYQARTKHGALVDASEVAPSISPIERSRMLYMADFREFITGDRKNNPGIDYELIYSDSPVKPMKWPPCVSATASLCNLEMEASTERIR